MANIITELHLEMSSNWYVTKKLNSVGRVGENTVTKLIIEPTEILDGVTYEIEIADASGSKNVAELTVDGTELYLILTANMLTTSGITKMQVRGLFTDGSIKKSNIFELKVNRSISATEAYEEYAVTIFDQLVQDCRDIIEGAESYAVRAETAAVNAEAYEQSASASAQAASGYADNASSYADNAASSASNASNSATSASTSASNAATSETNAAASAALASTSAANANTSATNAANSASSAATSASNAAVSATNASNSETNASTSAAEAEASAESIAASVSQINENTYRINDLEAIIGGYQLTDLPTGAVASVTDGTALLMPSLKIGIEPVQEGSGDPSPENIRPISGWTAANVNISQNAVTCNSTDFIKLPYPIENNETYAFRTLVQSKITQIELYDTDKVYIDWWSAYYADTVKTNNSGKTIKYIKLRANSPQVPTNLRNATKGETYTGQTYNIQFTDGDNPLTVYGGTLDVTTGELVADRASVDLGDYSWTGSNNRFNTTTTLSNAKAGTHADCICSQYKPDIGASTRTSDFSICFANNGYCYIYDTSFTGDAIAFKQAMNGVQLVYELATPTTYHLTPTQVRTLVGNNNIWADTGDIIEGKYYRSPF